MDELDRAVADTVADLEAKRRARAERADWQPVDLAPILAGEVVDAPPSILLRTDEVGLFYPGKVHLVYGEPESAKGWLVLAACAERMELGEPVLYVDFEDSAPTAIGRLRDLGVADEKIRRLFTYIRPDTPADAAVVANIPGIGASLTVLDGVTEAMTLHGLELADNADVAKFVELLARPLARMGAAVVLVDHVAKDRNGRGRFALGAQHKLAGIDGSAYAIEVIRPFGRGMTGLSRLTVTKDRPGYVRPASAYGNRAGDVHLVSDAEDGSVRVRIEPATTAEEEGWRPTFYMERVSRYLETAGEQTIRGVRGDVKGKGEYISTAIHQLVAEGYVARREGPRDSVLVSSIRPFREDDG
jgi:AAA domain